MGKTRPADIPAPGLPTAGLAGRARIRQVMELARRHLRMDVTLVSRIADGAQHFRAVDGHADSFDLAVGGSVPLEETYCDLMLRGQIPHVVPDVAAVPALQQLEATAGSAISAYAGVPLRHSDGTLYGTLCCIGHGPAPHLDDRDTAFLAMLAELLVDDLDAERARELATDRIAQTLRDERLSLALQPVVELISGRCIGFEALSRFDYGPPDVVFAQAEEVGLGVELERLAARKAAALVPQLRGDRYLAANLTPKAAVALGELAVHMPGLPWERMVLEITEHSSVIDYSVLRQVLQPLRERGMRVAIDDAGAGFASLHHVAKLEPDIIKVDRSLIAGLDSSRAQRSIVASFVLLGLDSGASLVAEGVETREELCTLIDLGVDAAQGYLLGRPSTDPLDLEHWLDRNSLLP